MTAKTKSETASPVAPGFSIEVTEKEVEATRVDIRIRLRQAILNFKHNGEIGRIHGLLSDLRALDYVNPTKVEAPKDPPKQLTPEEKRKADEIAARQAAAANDELMQKQNRETAKRESKEIAKEEGNPS